MAKSKVSELISHWRQVGPVEWAENRYGWTDIDGAPIRLTPWQKAFLQAWWDNRQDVTTLACSNVKKTGKTFVTALLTCWRWLTLPGLHFCVANDHDQAQARQFSEIASMVKRNQYLRQNVRVTKSVLTFEPTGSELVAIASDYQGVAGANFISASHTETWAVLYEGARRLVEELTPIPGDFYGLPCLRICDSYAGYEGESDFWHDLVDRGLQGQPVSDQWPIFKNGGLLLFHMEGQEAQQKCFRGTEQEAKIYYDEQRATLRPNAYTRLHENRRTASIGNFCDPDDWKALIDPAHKQLEPGAREVLYVGLDLATAANGDNCAFVACYADRDKKVRLAFHKLWKGKDRKEQLKLTETVLPYLLGKMKQYRISTVFLDPWQGQMLAEELRGKVRVVQVAQTHSTRGEYDTRLLELVKNKQLVLYDHDDVRHAAAGVSVKELPDGRIFLQKAGRLKIDFVIALSLAACHVGTTRYFGAGRAT